MNLHKRFLRWAATARERRDATAARRAHTGPGAKLARSVQVYGWAHVRIGRRTLICDDTVLNALNMTYSKPAIVIGDYCFLGRRNFLNAGPHLTIGDYCLTGTDCHFLGCDHAHESPLTPYLAAGNEPGGAIALGTNVWLGARVTIMKNVQIGCGSIVGAASLVTKDVPPFSIAVGHPARALKRYSLPRKSWVLTAEFSAEDHASLPTEAEYAADLRRSQPHIPMPYRALGRECGDF